MGIRAPRAAATTVGIGAIIALLAAPGVASADTDVDVPFVWAESSVEIEYGQYWTFSGEASDSLGFPADPPPSAALSNASDYSPTLTTHKTPNYRDAYTVGPSERQSALGAGSYQVLLTATGIFREPDGLLIFHLKPATTAQLTVKPAQLGVDFRILSDTNNRDGAVITARLTGNFAEQYPFSAGYVVAGTSPGGSWVYSITDSSGKAVLEKTVDTAAGSPALATSFYWFDAQPGETYAATAIFTPDEASTKNFTITQAAEFSYTAPKLQRLVPQSSLAPVPNEVPAAASGLAFPLWALLLFGLLALGLAAAVVLLSLRFARRQHGETAGSPDLFDAKATTTKESAE